MENFVQCPACGSSNLSTGSNCYNCGAPLNPAYGAGPGPGQGYQAPPPYGSQDSFQGQGYQTPPPYGPQDSFQGQGYQTPPPYGYPPVPPKEPASGIAIASLVLGIVGLVCCGVTALVGLPLGIVAQIKHKNGLALGGIITSAAAIVIWGLLFIFGAVLGNWINDYSYYFDW